MGLNLYKFDKKLQYNLKLFQIYFCFLLEVTPKFTYSYRNLRILSEFSLISDDVGSCTEL